MCRYPDSWRGASGRCAQKGSDMDGEEHVESDLLDVTGLDLDQVAALPPSALAIALRRVLDDEAEPADYYAAFQNSM